DQEHRAPAGELHQHPAEDLAGDEADRGDRAVQADGAGTLGALGQAGGGEGRTRRRARVRSGPSGKPVVMRDSAAGATMAAPAPCTTRAAISSMGSWARPPARLARAKATRPTTNMRRRPSRSAARPPRIRRPPNEMAYPVTIHWTASAGI